MVYLNNVENNAEFGQKLEFKKFLPNDLQRTAENFVCIICVLVL